MIIESRIFDDILVSVGVPKGKVGDCLRWAVGDDIESLELDEFFDRWNELHSATFTIAEDTEETFDDVLSRIGLAYLQQLSITEKRVWRWPQRN